ncbi:MAG: PH domain-containing protein [Actinobacteria bacterium]|nr:PH domain-containing protein [Actinomycetota bacterium]
MEKPKQTDKKDLMLREIEYLLEPSEHTVLSSRGILNNLVEGYLVLTDRKLCFYFKSNINIDKKFIATYPYLAKVSLSEGLLFSSLTITNAKNQSFSIGKINKEKARKFYEALTNIIKINQKTQAPN